MLGLLMDFEGNFKKRLVLDVTGIKAKIRELSEDAWEADDFRQSTYSAHRDTQTINLLFDSDFRHANPSRHPHYWTFKPELETVFANAKAVYAGGDIVRCMFVRLRPHGEISEHVDKGISLARSHRLHLPIITSEGVQFVVGGQMISMKEGELWEINNLRPHSVKNTHNQARVHLILDWSALSPNGFDQ